jgi:transposase-like protein
MAQTRPDIERVVRRRRWSEADARTMVQAWRSSGESQRVFARRHGLDPQRIGHWVRRLRAEIVAEESPMPFHPVRLLHRGAATTGMSEQSPIEIVLPMAEWCACHAASTRENSASFSRSWRRDHAELPRGRSHLCRRRGRGFAALFRVRNYAECTTYGSHGVRLSGGHRGKCGPHVGCTRLGIIRVSRGRPASGRVGGSALP